ncbi:MAG: trypsin-like peptidase domain-containing protein, partial [Erysipelotrichaceae bacterium]|nr:trypsin-like peptidase domain-containing protein [Erysipelotrichaceae bacterium]
GKVPIFAPLNNIPGDTTSMCTTILAGAKATADGSLIIARSADSDALKAGQPCMAIGNPLGTLGGTVTTGIISALSRNIKIDSQEMTLLQTNTAINPGNSGGGLFDYSGNLIGIVNAKSSGENIEGIGFAIPINDAKDIIFQLIQYGYVIGRPMLGITGTPISSLQQAYQLGLRSYGVLVKELLTDEAKESGLQVDDLIIMIDNYQIAGFTDIRNALLNYNAGDKVTLMVLRNGQRVSIELKLAQKRTITSTETDD